MKRNMPPKIMVLTESYQIHWEAVRYSIALAQRLDAVLILLMLLHLESTPKTPRGVNTVLALQTRGEQVIRQPIAEMEKAGISVESAIRIGDPRSELLKFLAESDRFHSIVWGGDGGAIHEKQHWMSNLGADVKSAVLVPYAKTEAAV
jgi:hypothetical protein